MQTEIGGTADPSRQIVYHLGGDVDPTEIAAVYQSVGWQDVARDPARLGVALRASAAVASAWDGERAVGVARLLSDGVFQGYVVGVAVRPDYQGRGVGSRLVRMLLDTDPGLTFHLRTRNRRFTFYERLGFQRHDTAMERPPVS